MEKQDKELMLNGSGVSDPTAYCAIRNVAQEEFENKRFSKLLNALFCICEISGFQLVGRIHVIDRKTGREWQ